MEPVAFIYNIMNRLFNVAMVFLFMSICVGAYAQTAEEKEYQEYVKKSKENFIKKQKLLTAQTGVHYGLNLSLGGGYYYWDYIEEKDRDIDYDTSSEIGLEAFYGKRFNEYWMLSGIIGIDYKKATCSWPRRLSVYDWESCEEQYSIIGIPIMGGVRFYPGIARVMPYFYTRGGAYISRCIGYTFDIGIGLDYNFKNSNTVFVALGYSAKTLPGKTFDIKTMKTTDKYHAIGTPGNFSLKIGVFF